MYQRATAPQSIGGVLDSGFKLFQASIKDTFVIALVGALVSSPFALIAERFATRSPGPATVLAIVFGALVLLAVTLAVYATIIARIDAVANGRELPLSEALAYGARRGAPMFLTGALFGLAVTLGMILLVIPGIIAIVWFVFGMQITVTERMGPLASLGYSRQLVHGHWWRTAALLTVIGIIVGVLYFILGMVVAFAVGLGAEEIAATGRMPWYVDFVLTPIITAIGTPLAYSMLIATFYDLKSRHEGGDIAERIAAATA